MVAAFRFRFQIDWRRGSKELRVALDEMRGKVLQEIGDQVRDNAPHPSLAAAVTVSASQVTINHPAALIFEYGMSAGKMPPVGPLKEWALKVGKDPNDMFAVAMGIKAKGIEAQPWMEDAVAAGLETAPEWMRRIWERSRGFQKVGRS